MTIHKSNDLKPLVSIILLDWSVREYFQALKWLNRQDVERGLYELIWVELHDRVAPEAMEACDVVITCGQKGIYHKHKGYNVGLLQARGKIVTICDSDAIFPPNFVRSIIESFEADKGEPQPLVLMHYQWRTRFVYPENFDDLKQVDDYEWLPLWPNVGACATFRRSDAIGFGGFDEHRSFRGYLCGPYDLAWRLMNAGIPEKWHDESVASWHFAHPAPADFRGGFSWEKWREKKHIHINHVAFDAVQAFVSGRLSPRLENPDVFKVRMAQRRIDTEYEQKYGDAAQMGHHFTPLGKLKLLASFWFEGLFMEGRLRHHYRDRILIPLVQAARSRLGSRYYEAGLSFFHRLIPRKRAR